MNQKAHGFTIVELLIVIVVIAVLAAISIVAYNGVSNNAHDTAVRSDLSKFANKIEAYRAEWGKYPSTTVQLTAALEGFGATRPSYDTGYYNFTIRVANDRDQFVVAARSKSQKIWYRSTNDNGQASIGSTYTGTVGALIGISEPATESVYSAYGYQSNTDTWNSWIQ